MNPDADTARPVDALGVAQDDVVDVSRGKHVVLRRVLGGEPKTVWQTNFTEPMWLSAVTDLDGDGTDEIALFTGDSSGARAVVLGAGGAITHTLGPIRGASRRAGYPWDGKIAIAAAIETPRGRRVVCKLLAGFGGEPRGIALYDLASGAPEWQQPIGGQPNQVVVADLDGDALDDILVTTHSPHNGIEAGGLDDSHIHVVAFGADGARRWHATVGGYFASAHATVIAAPDGGPARVVVTTHSARGDRPEPGLLLALDGASGRELDRLVFPGGLGAPVRVLGGAPHVVVGGADGRLLLFTSDLEPVASARFDAPAEAAAVADLDGDGRPEILASTPSEVLVLDRRLRVLGRERVAHVSTRPILVGVARAGLDRTRVLVHHGPARLLDVTPLPPLANTRVLGAVAGLALAAGLAAAVIERARRARRLPAGAEARDFLIEYHQIRHETFDQERPFARVRLWAQAETAGHPMPVGVLEGACNEFLRIGSPSLDRFVNRARAMRVSGRLVRIIRTHDREIANGLRAALAAKPQDRGAAVQRVLRSIARLSRACFAAYREVALREPCRADREAQEALLAKRESLDLLGVATAVRADASGRRFVLFDPGELRALVGELLENAMRALAGVPAPRITIAVSGHPTDPRCVVVRVEDNGAGLPADGESADLRARRPDGGTGLSLARESAHRWLGDLVLEERASGRGATARIVLRALLPHEPTARAVAHAIVTPRTPSGAGTAAARSARA